MPRNPHEPSKQTRDTVTALSAAGVRQDLISRVLGISVPTLEKAYRQELDVGKSTITALAVATLVKAMNAGGRGAVGAAAFWLKCREGWQETSQHRFVDGEGKDRSLSLDAVREYMRNAPEEGESRRVQ